MTISYELYLQKSIVCHLPKYTQELSLQMRRECIFPPKFVYIAMTLYSSTEERPAEPQSLLFI